MSYNTVTAQDKSAPPPSYEEKFGAPHGGPPPVAFAGGPQGPYNYPNQPAQGYPNQQPYQGQGYPNQQPYLQPGYPVQPYNATVMQPQSVIYIQPQPLDNPPNDYLGYSIFVTVCCCWLIGIFAIIKSSECRTAARNGNRPEAEQKSRDALKLSHAALGLGIVCVVISIIIVVVYVVAAVNAVNRRY